MTLEVKEHHLFRGGFYQDPPSYVGPSRVEGDVQFVSPSQGAGLKLHHPLVVQGDIDFGGYSPSSYTDIVARNITGAFNVEATRIVTEGDISVAGVLRVTHLKAGGTVTCDRLELQSGGTIQGNVVQRRPFASGRP